ncbi:MAG: hypothetical protein LBI13_06810 [Streptococcaceae bacterium]|jgi:hypothetical protein|nr:hypothetical protein [Streptococcaceae bacterium]
MKFRYSLWFSWLYKKRNFKRLLFFDLQFLFTLISINTFALLFFYFRANNKILVDFSISSFLSGSYELLKNMKSIISGVFLVFSILSVAYMIFMIKSYISTEHLFDKVRLQNYLEKTKDKKQASLEFYLSRFLFIPIFIVLVEMFAVIVVLYSF